MSLLTTCMLVLSTLCSSSSTYAQTESIEHEGSMGELIAGFGLNAGYGISQEERGLLLEGYYDVPIASIYFSPAVRLLLLTPNSMFSVDVRLKTQLWSTGSTQGFISLGGNFMTWEDRASFGIPVDLSVAVPLMHRLQVVVGANATPQFFLGPERDGVFYGIFAGLRSPVL